jgi:serine/threonine-protein kinase
MLGTPYYMSPEQGFGEADLDSRSDAWSFGVLAYEVLAGVRPVRGENLGQVLKSISQGARPPLEGATEGVPPAVCHAIDALLVSDRESRGSLASFVEACAAPRDLGPSQEDVPRAPRRSAGLVKRRPAVLVAAAALALVVGSSGLVVARLGAGASAVPVRAEPSGSTAVATKPPDAIPAAVPSAPPVSVSSSSPTAQVHVPPADASPPPRASAPPPTKPVSSPSPAPPSVPTGSVGRGAGGVVVTPPF